MNFSIFSNTSSCNLLYSLFLTFLHLFFEKIIAKII
nr:MAG TPA: hypothetical protein [Caudoviricetes sp.]